MACKNREDVFRLLKLGGVENLSEVLFSSHVEGFYSLGE